MGVRDWSLITGMGGGGAYKMGKMVDSKPSATPLKTVKLFAPPPPPSLWRKLQAPVLKLPQNLLCPPPPPFSMAKTLSAPPLLYVGVKNHLRLPPRNDIDSFKLDKFIS